MPPKSLYLRLNDDLKSNTITMFLLHYYFWLVAGTGL